MAEAGDEPFVVTQTFDAPRGRVFRAWTDQTQLAAWWGPKGMELFACTVDLRPGGRFHYGLKLPDGAAMWGRWVFRDMVAPQKLVFVASFSDADGGVTRHPWSADWPLETLSTVVFEARGEQTLLTMTGVALNASETERNTFVAGFASMRQGFGGTFEQLAAFLAKG